MNVREYLRDITPTHFHVFDSYQESMDERGMSHKDQDYQIYSYNIHKNNKPCVGDVFLYRRPKSSSKTKKFYIYGGGVIQSISTPDSQGNVEARIERPFQLETPLSQGDAHLENFIWTSKSKRNGSWVHFWNQYGMNVIEEQDFWGLVGELPCIAPEIYNALPSRLEEALEEKTVQVDELNIAGFRAIITHDDATDRKNRTRAWTSGVSREIIGTHIDYKELQNKKSEIGKAGELLVLELLCEKYEGTDAKIEHVSAAKGDNYGYDIRVLERNGQETLIEVKTTNSPSIDGFYITPNELRVARECEDDSSQSKKYQIYRVYNFDSRRKTANIKIYEGPFREEFFRFEPTAWKVYKK